MAKAQTAPMAAATSGGLQSPRSPTLSCADMILPESSLRSYSPTPYIDRPPSPSAYAQTNEKPHPPQVSTTQSRRDPSPNAQARTPSFRSSRSTLRSMGGSNGSFRQRKGAEHVAADGMTLASSPTIADSIAGQWRAGWAGHENDWRRLSNASSSVKSEDLENITWPGFNGAGAFDDSGVALEEEPGIAHPEEDVENDKWLEEPHGDEDKDAYSSAALSRRAEIILANAKKRLNVMEGNLRGARQSLVVSPTFSTPAFSQQLAAARERDRKLYAGLGPIPPRKSYQASPLSASNSPGHSRGMSETSVPAPYTSTYTSRIANKRASSAMGVSSGPWAPENHGQGRFPVRETRSLETVSDHRNGWKVPDERGSSSNSHDSRGSRSPQSTLEPLPENDDDNAPYLRPSSTTGDLRAQMQDLKGRISSLKQKAKEDTMRRRSLQSLRTTSPFNNADTWYASADTYKAGVSPVTADAGIGVKTESPARKTLYEDASPSDESSKKVAAGEIHHQHSAPNQPIQQTQSRQQEHKESTEDSRYDDYADYDDEDSLPGDDDFAAVDDNSSSVYEDAVYEFPVTERHEDRVDAFDYEHFFLHSAMGTYSSERRGSQSGSSSAGSIDSVETTRPTTAVHAGAADSESAKRVSMHQRNSSVDSVSTVATFATAAEEQEEKDEVNERMDQFSQQFLATAPQVQNPQPRYTHVHPTPNGFPVPQSSAAGASRSNYAVNLRAATASPAQASIVSRSSSQGSDLATGLQISKIYSILLEARTPDEPRLALSEEEKQLIYGLAASFQQVCANLQSTAGDQYDRKEWRRRLDEARRVLNGEETESSSF